MEQSNLAAQPALISRTSGWLALPTQRAKKTVEESERCRRDDTST